MLGASGLRQGGGLEFRILGPLEVEGDGGLVPLGGHKQRAVLAVLLLNANKPVAADRLIEDVWGETASGCELRSLRVYVSNPNNETSCSEEVCGSTSDAGAEGLEPPAYGFGDRRSTN